MQRLGNNLTMIHLVRSKNGSPVRLTDERWTHISKEHFEMADLRATVLDTIARPGFIFAGHHGELLAVRQIKTRLWLVAATEKCRMIGLS